MKKAAILVLVLLLGLTGCSTVTNVGKVNDLITEGDQAYENKDYEGAIKAYTAALELDAKKDTAYNNRGLAYMELEQYGSGAGGFHPGDCAER